MKERMPFTLDMDMLKSEAIRASMHVEEWKEGVAEDATEISMIVSNYIHPISVVGQLLILVRNTLEVTDFFLVNCTTSNYQSSSTRINVVVVPRFKEQPNAS